MMTPSKRFVEDDGQRNTQQPHHDSFHIGDMNPECNQDEQNNHVEVVNIGRVFFPDGIQKWDRKAAILFASND